MAAMRRLAATPLLTVAALAVLAALAWPNPATGVILPPPPPLGVLGVVNTPSDLVDTMDGTCSLRAAIEATNLNGHAGNCDATGSEPGATDGIIFNIGAGTPTINVTSSLPNITDKLSINGAGPATRVELHGPGNGTGLDVFGSGAASSSIRNLVINGFGTGIYLDHTSGVTIAGNYIGTNSAGSAAVPNSLGIYAYYGSAQVGGLNGLTPGGPCTGDCNLISGNTGDGVHIHEFGGGLIEGNFAGTDVTGTLALGNGGVASILVTTPR